MAKSKRTPSRKRTLERATTPATQRGRQKRLDSVRRRTPGALPEGTISPTLAPSRRVPVGRQLGRLEELLGVSVKSRSDFATLIELQAKQAGRTEFTVDDLVETAEDHSLLEAVEDAVDDLIRQGVRFSRRSLVALMVRCAIG